MTDPTLLSKPQLQSDEAEPSNTNLPTPSLAATKLSDIPHFSQSKPNQNSAKLNSPPSEPSLCEETESSSKYEYEFSFLYGGTFACIHLYDVSDISACERVLHRPVKAEEITYSDSGNGFIKDEDFKFTFTKQPYQRTYITSIPSPKPKSRMVTESAADVLASL